MPCMPLFDLSSPDLETHRTQVQPPEDLDRFWEQTLRQARAAGGAVLSEPTSNGLQLVDTWDVSYPGFDGQPVKAWYHRPAGRDDPLPVVVQFQGYGGGRGLPHEVRPWTLAGYATLSVDTRGQGAMWGQGDTPDPIGSHPSYPGFLSRGVRDPATYYYRRVYTDAALAVDATAHLPGTDGRVVVSGASQGGAMALAAAAVHGRWPDSRRAAQVVGAIVDVPFLCDIPRAMNLTPDGPYAELTSYLAVHRRDVAAVLGTLAYHDGAVLAEWADCPALFSVGIMDTTCPPSTVYAAFNAYHGPKRIEPYHYNEHEGGGAVHVGEQLVWLTDLLGPPAVR